MQYSASSSASAVSFYLNNSSCLAVELMLPQQSNTCEGTDPLMTPEDMDQTRIIRGHTRLSWVLLLDMHMWCHSVLQELPLGVGKDKVEMYFVYSQLLV